MNTPWGNGFVDLVLAIIAVVLIFVMVFTLGGHR
jgi:hypothetical protein